MPSYRIDSVKINVERRELKIGEKVNHIEPQAFDLLVYLLSNRDHVVSKDELLDHVWKTPYVSESAVSVRIRQLRKVLGDNGRDQRIIRTYHGKGYRIVADVLETEALAADSTSGTILSDITPDKIAKETDGAAPDYSNLPRQRVELVGRQKDLARAIDSLSQRPLITLIGPGGVGKSTLALEIGRRCTAYRKVVLCELASCTPETLTDAVLGSFESSAGNKEVTVPQLVDSIGEGRVLLILDNCEHIIDPVVELCEGLLNTKTDLSILTTSREALGIDLERVIILEGLDTTKSEADAVVLFRKCALHSADYTIADSEFSLAQKIVSQLDGLPLAIELAAPRLIALSLKDLSEALQNSMELLKKNRASSPRQLTMESTIAWSYDLLSLEEQETLNELSVFKDLFTVEAVNAVVTAEQAGALLHRLIEQSVVTRRDVRSETRYRLLEPIRQFVANKLEEDIAIVVRERHAQFYLERVHVIADGLRGRNEARFAQILTQEWRDIAAAIKWKEVNNKHQQAIDAILALGWHLIFQHRFEAFDWLESLIETSVDSNKNTNWTLALRAMGVAFNQGDLVGAEQLLTEASSERDENFNIAFAWFFVLMAKGDFKSLVPHCDALCRLTEEPENKPWRVVSESIRTGVLAMVDPNAPELDTLIDRVKALETKTFWPLGLSWIMLNQYVVAVGRQQSDLADELLKKISKRSKEWHLSWFATTAGAVPRRPADPLQHLAVIVKTMSSALESQDLMQMPALVRTLFVTLVLCERMDSAVRVHGLIPQLKGFGDSGSDVLAFDKAVQEAKRSVSIEQFAALEADGSQMNLDQILELAEAELASLQSRNEDGEGTA